MRRSDREVTDFNEIIEIMRRCKVCHVAFYDNDYPYIVPMNFGMCVDGEKITLYFHGAKSGKKHDLLKVNNKVCFVMENMIAVNIYDTACKSGAEYESVIGTGVIEYADGKEKLHGLNCIMAQYVSDQAEGFHFDDEHTAATAVLRLSVNTISAKRRL